MKSCNEMVAHLLTRREQYEIQRKNRNKILIRTLLPACCICLIALAGFVAWQGGMFDRGPTQTAQDAIFPGIKDWYGPGEEEQNDNFVATAGDYPTATQSDNDVFQLLGVIEYNGNTYVQIYSAAEHDIILGEKISNGEDFEGTCHSMPGVLAEVYSVMNYPELLAAKMDDGTYVILQQVVN